MECNFFATKPRNSRSSSVLFGIIIYECSYLSVQPLLFTLLFAHIRTLQGHHYLMIKRRGGKLTVVWVVEMKINKMQTHLLHSHSHSQSSSMDCCCFLAWHWNCKSAEFTGVYVNLMRVFWSSLRPITHPTFGLQPFSENNKCSIGWQFSSSTITFVYHG